MTINSPVHSPVNSPVRSNRRNSWEASLEQNGREPRLKTERHHSRSRNVSASPPRSGGESDDEDDADFSRFSFDDDNESTCSGSEEQGTQEGKGTWTKEEHKRFLEAIKLYANGPWKLVAEYVGTRTVRQTMTHAQKYRQKAARRIRGLRTKQAIMRMHIGHEVSEESMLQERIRTAMSETRGGYLPDYTAMLRSPHGSPVMPSSPVMQPGLAMGYHSPVMPGSPVGNQGPMLPHSPIANSVMFPNNSVSLPMPNEQFAPISLPPLSLEVPLSITVRTPQMDGSMPVYAAATPPSSLPGSPAVSPVSALTSRMNALAPHFDYDEPELEIIEDLTNGPTLQECANELMDVLFDGPTNQEEPVKPMPLPSLPDFNFDI